MTDTEALLVLNMLPKIGPVRVRRLVELCGTPAAVLQASSSTLQQVSGIGTETAGKVGPPLVGLFGRAAASYPEFRYSTALENCMSSVP